MPSKSGTFAAACALVLSAACGGTGGSGTSTPPASSSDVASYQQFALNVQSAATTYRTTASSASDMSTMMDCQSAEDHYDAQVRPWISQMAQMSVPLDDVMVGHGGSGAADMGCLSSAMMQELNQHQQIACSSTDLSVDRAEAVRHANAMISYATHASDRSSEMMNGFNGGTWSWGPMMSGCASDQGGMGTGGGMMGGR